MEGLKLEDYQLEELSLGLLPLLENSYNFRFKEDELSEVVNFEGLIDVILDRIDLDNDELCTSQIAFYELRQAIARTKIYDAQRLTPETSLEELLPAKGRRKQLKYLEQNLGYELRAISPNVILILILTFALIGSFIVLFYNLSIGLVGVLISLFFLRIVSIFGKTLNYITVRELIEDTLSVNYLRFRKGKNRINKKELRIELNKWFSRELDLTEDELNKVVFDYSN